MAASRRAVLRAAVPGVCGYCTLRPGPGRKAKLEARPSFALGRLCSEGPAIERPDEQKRPLEVASNAGSKAKLSVCKREQP
jgi:hypothetical protein